MATLLTPDKTTTLNGVTVKEFLLTKHNPNKIDMPSGTMNNVIGVTIHNTDWLASISNGTTQAEQYTRATYNGNMKSTRVHFYVDNKCAWQNLPLTLHGWHAADGNGNGNRKTIAIECIMSSKYNDNDKKSEDNAAKLAAYLLKKYNLSINHLYTHTHWLNVMHGKSGSVDRLNTMYNSYKNCPAYILPHWASFKAKVQAYMNSGNVQANSSNSSGTSESNAKKYYRIRKSWSDAASQIGAYTNLDNAKNACKSGYTVYDWNGNAVYPTATITLKIGDKVKVKSGAKAYNGQSLASFVYKTTYTILQINGDRIVIGLDGAVTAAVHKNNLIKV